MKLFKVCIVMVLMLVSFSVFASDLVIARYVDDQAHFLSQSEQNNLAEKLKNYENKTTNQVAITTLAEKGILSLAGRAALSVVPGLNFLSFAMFACQMGSWIALAFKDNKYEAWAKGSTLSKD